MWVTPSKRDCYGQMFPYLEKADSAGQYRGRTFSVRTVPQVKEPPGRDRFPCTEGFQSLHEWCEENDLELDAFLVVAGTTSLSKIPPKKV